MSEFIIELQRLRDETNTTKDINDFFSLPDKLKALEFQATFGLKSTPAARTTKDLLISVTNLVKVLTDKKSEHYRKEDMALIRLNLVAAFDNALREINGFFAKAQISGSSIAGNGRPSTQVAELEQKSARAETEFKGEVAKLKAQITQLRTQKTVLEIQIEQERAETNRISTNKRIVEQAKAAAEQALSQMRTEKIKAETQWANDRHRLAEMERDLGNERKRSGRRTDSQSIRSNLLEEKNGLPASLQKLVTDLMEVIRYSERGDQSWLLSNLDQIERSVYKSPEAMGLLAYSNNDQSETLTERFHQIAVLQKEAHNQLAAVGIVPIYPALRDSFDVKRHQCLERDIVIVNTHRNLHNTIHTVLRIGFTNANTNEVIRKAAVRKCLFEGSTDADSTVTGDPNDGDNKAKFGQDEPSDRLAALTDENERLHQHVSELKESLRQANEVLAQERLQQEIRQKEEEEARRAADLSAEQFKAENESLLAASERTQIELRRTLEHEQEEAQQAEQQAKILDEQLADERREQQENEEQQQRLDETNVPQEVSLFSDLSKPTGNIEDDGTNGPAPAPDEEEVVDTLSAKGDSGDMVPVPPVPTEPKTAHGNNASGQRDIADLDLFDAGKGKK